MLGNKKSKYFDKIILISSLFFFTIALIFIINDGLLFKKNEFSENVEIGHITAVTSDVRKKDSKKIVWEEAEIADKIRKNEMVFTGDNSSVSIVLQDGSIFHLSENTLIVLNIDEEIPKLKIIKGGLSGKLGSSALISFKSKKVEHSITGENASINLSLNKDQSANIEIVEGTARLDDLSLKAKKAVFINQSSIKYLDMSLQTTNPKNNHVSWHRSMQFNWIEFIGTKHYLLELSKNIYFKNPVKIAKAELNSVMLQDLPYSLYFWRVKAIGTNDDIIGISTTQTFQLKEDRIPAPVNPTFGDIINFPVKLNISDTLKKVFFKWQDETLAFNYRIQVAKDNRFKKPIVDKKIQQQFYEGKLQLGKYYWRVAVNDNRSRDLKWSKPADFKLQMSARLSAPEFALPSKNQHKEFISSIKNMVNFKLADELKDATVIIELSEDNDFSKKC